MSIKCPNVYIIPVFTIRLVYVYDAVKYRACPSRYPVERPERLGQTDASKLFHHRIKLVLAVHFIGGWKRKKAAVVVEKNAFCLRVVPGSAYDAAELQLVQHGLIAHKVQY